MLSSAILFCAPIARSNKASIATFELRELRHKYGEAYTHYLSCVQALSEASQKGVWPSAEKLRADEKAFNELAFARRVLTDMLYEHTHGAKKKPKVSQFGKLSPLRTAPPPHMNPE